MPDDKPSAGFDPLLRAIYDQTWQVFATNAAARLARGAPVTWSNEFQVDAVPFLPATSTAWLALLLENPWLLDTDYGSEDVAGPYPTQREVLRASVLTTLTDAMLAEVDDRLPAVGTAIDARAPAPPRGRPAPSRDQVPAVLAQLTTEGYKLKEILIFLTIREVLLTAAGRRLEDFTGDLKLLVRAAQRVCGSETRMHALEARLTAILGPVESLPVVQV